MSAPFMQLYVADYLGDTRHLTTEQHGAYMLLLMSMWRADGRLPADPKKLARITGCTPSRWAKIQAEVMEFFEVDGDEITNQRLMFELEKASEKSIKRAEAGTKGGKAKALKTNKATVAIATVLPKHSSEPESEEKEPNGSLSLVAQAPTRRASRRCPADWLPSEGDLAAGAGFNPGEIERELAKFRDFTFATSKSDWSATFRNWLRTAAERRPRNEPANAKLDTHNANLSRAQRGFDLAASLRAGR